MGLATFSIYKYVRTSKGWRHCKPIYGKSNKLKPDAVLVDGKEELHTDPNLPPWLDRCLGVGRKASLDIVLEMLPLVHYSVWAPG